MGSAASRALALEAAESRVLSLIKTSPKHRAAVKISNKNYINTIFFGFQSNSLVAGNERSTEDSPPTADDGSSQDITDVDESWYKNAGTIAKKPILLLVHGLGAGVGMWHSNVDAFSEHYSVIAIDLLGFGRSSRPPFSSCNPEDSQTFWRESIEEFRQQIGVESFTIVGHSLGSYVSASYALAYPSRVDRLVLTAGVGIHRWNFQRLQGTRKVVVGIAYSLALTPQRIIRSFGPFSRSVFYHFTTRASKWYGFNPEFQEYIYLSSLETSSGEKVFLNLINPQDGWRLPLEDSLPLLTMPVTVVYGDRDFVQIKEPYEWNVSGKLDVTVLSEASHHLYATKASEFNNAVIGF